jgi:LacI family transcriptional regulator
MPSSNPLRIGLAGSIRVPILSRYLDGMRSYARVHGGIEIVDCRQAQEFPRFQPADLPLWRGRVDGVVLAAGYDGPADELIAWIGRGGVPAISVRADVFDPRLPVVCIDPESIARLATDHLLSLDVGSFLHVGSIRCNGTRRRAEALVRVLATRGRATAAHECDGLIFGGLDDEATLARDDQLTGLLSTLPRPIGVLCLNDLIARAVAIRCRSLGLEVGRDVLLVGVEDSPLAVESKPSITSIQVPCETVGARGLAALCEMIAAGRLTRPEMPVELVPATEIVLRESTAAQAADASPLANWLAYFDEHGHKGFATTRIAEDLGLTPRAFERQFQKLVGHSPAEEIRRRRMERAKTLLADRTVPIAGIAAAVGFSEAAAFSRFFRKHAGCTPREYRRDSAERLPG